MSQTSTQLRSMFISNLCDAAGIKLFDTIITLIVVLHLGFSATQLGLLNFLGALSFFILAIPSGIIVDHLGAIKSLIFSIAAKVIFLSLILVFFYLETLNPTTTLIIVAILGALSLFTETAQTTAAPLLTQKQNLISDIVAKLSAADQIMSVVMPVISGILFSLTGSFGSLLVAALLTFISLISALKLRQVSVINTNSKFTQATNKIKYSTKIPNEENESTPSNNSNSGSHNLLIGFQIIFKHRFLLATTLLVCATNIGLAIGDTLTDILLLRYMGVSPLIFGILEGIGAITGIVAALLTPKLLANFSTYKIFGYSAITQGIIACLPLVALQIPALSYPAMILLSASWAFIITITNIAGSAYAAQVVPQQLLGRSTGARRMIVMGAVPFAALSAGLLTDKFHLGIPLMLWPIITLVAAITFFILAKK